MVLLLLGKMCSCPADLCLSGSLCCSAVAVAALGNRCLVWSGKYGVFPLLGGGQ